MNVLYFQLELKLKYATCRHGDLFRLNNGKKVNKKITIICNKLIRYRKVFGGVPGVQYQ